MTLREIIEKYEVGKDKKNVIILEVPDTVKDNVKSLLVDGYTEVYRNPCTSIFYLYDIKDISKRTGIDFSNKVSRK